MIDCPDSKEVKNTSHLKKVYFDQQSSNSPIGMSYHEGDKGPKTPTMINLASTGIRISASLANKSKHKYSLFAEF